MVHVCAGRRRTSEITEMFVFPSSLPAQCVSASLFHTVGCVKASAFVVSLLF